jgi:MOSC domain-containing protein YiiM
VQPRTPCSTITIYGADITSAMYDARVQAHDPTSPLWGLSGFYCSVVHPGRIRAGDSITLGT